MPPEDSRNAAGAVDRKELGRMGAVLARMRAEGDFDGLIAALDDPREGPDGFLSVRGMAAQGLRKLGDRRAISNLARLLEDPNLGVQAAGAYALAEIADPSAATILIGALGHANRGVRLWAIEGLGRIGDRCAVPHLFDFLSAEEWDFRRRAAQALAKIGGPEAIEAVRAAAKREPLHRRMTLSRILRSFGENEGDEGHERPH